MSTRDENEAAQQQALIEWGQEQRDLHGRAAELVRTGSRWVGVNRIVPLGDDDMLIETTETRKHGKEWRIVADGRLISRVTTSLEYAMLIWIGERRGDHNAYIYAARVLGLPDEIDAP